VILFGEMQIHVPLPAAERRAILGFLDPITGEESFREVTSLDITPPPERYTDSQARAHFEYITRCLAEEANARGAKRPSKLTVPSYDLGPPAVEYVFVPVWKTDKQS
jgi:hypothetical protein